MIGRSLTFAALAAAMLPCAAQSPALTSAEAAQAISQFLGASGASEKDWSTFLADTSAGSVSAFGMLGIDGEAVTPVENVRDVVVAVRNLGSGGTGMGFSVTPARTSITPMSLSTYAGSKFDRLLGSLAFGYAQATANVSGRSYEQRAFSVETNYFFRNLDDPVLAVAEAFKRGKGDCDIFALTSKPPAPPSGAPKPGPGAADAAARAPAVANEDVAKIVRERAESCRTSALNAMRWNRSQIAAAYATGTIQPEDGNGGKESLGHSLMVGVTYGFDHSEFLKDNAALYFTLRHTADEPVLTTLQSASVERKDNSLAVLRFTAGSKNARALAEVSNARKDEVTSSQRAFKQALGFDYKLAEGTWLNFRTGKQQTFDGSSEQTSTLFSISYSPTPLLK
jgi:hypothetical protein